MGRRSDGRAPAAPEFVSAPSGLPNTRLSGACRCGAEFGGRMETQSPLLADRHPRVALARPHGQPLVDYDDHPAMAQVVVDAIREPALLLDGRLRVVAANRGYCLAFKAERKNVQGRPVRAISDRRWDTPEVRAMLVRIRARSFSADFHEMEQDVPGAGRRTLILHASGGVDEAQARRLLLLSIEDVSDRRAAERESEGCSSRWRRCCWQISTRSPTACRSSRASSS